jgi:hypothetical protein
MTQIQIEGSPLDEGLYEIIEVVNNVEGVRTKSSCSGLHDGAVGCHLNISFENLECFNRYRETLQSFCHIRTTHAPGKIQTSKISVVLTPLDNNYKLFWIKLSKTFRT